MKRSFSSPFPLVVAAAALIAATYGLVRLAYGLHLPDMRSELGFDAAIGGAISSGGSVAYCAGAVVGFLLAPRRARALVGLAGATAALGSAGMAIAPSAALLAPAAVLASCGAGLASPALVRLLQGSIDEPELGRAQTVVNAGTGPGLVAAGALALLLVPQWRLAWWIAAAVSLAAAVAVLLIDRSRGQAERTALPPASWYRAHRTVIAAALLAGAASAAVWNSGRALLQDSGASSTTAVLAWIALGLGGLAVVPTAGRMSALPPHRAWTITTIALGASTAALAAAPAWTPLALLACSVFGWGYTAATGALIAWTASIDRDRAASGTALLFVLLVLGQAVGAAIAGAAIVAAGYPPAFLGAAAAAAAAALLGLLGSGHRAQRVNRAIGADRRSSPAAGARRSAPTRRG